MLIVARWKFLVGLTPGFAVVAVHESESGTTLTISAMQRY